MALAMLTVSLTAREAAAETRSLPVPAVTILPKTIISSTHVKSRLFRVTPTSTAGFATDVSQVIGKQAHRRLIGGKPIPLSALSAPLAVRRGAVVVALYQKDGFSIATSLVALQDGTEGDVIEARNTATGAVVLATVKSDGTLAVDGQ